MTLSVLSFIQFISKQAIANSNLSSNVSSNDFKSESHIYGVVSSAKFRPSQIACKVMTVHLMPTQTVLHVHENLCTVLIKTTIENYLLPAHTDHYVLRK